MAIEFLLEALGREIEDPEEESFLLFSQPIPSQNLGFVDSKATVLDLSVGGRDLSIQQSPTILASNRKGGTTGAVVWKITPLFASWITSSSNLLFRTNILGNKSTVLELGCGISGIIGLSLGPLIDSYILTDQDYVMKLLHRNLNENCQSISPSSSKGRKGTTKPKRGTVTVSPPQKSNIISVSLDWETDEIATLLMGNGEKPSCDAVITCDCIYNEALIEPLVQTCINACRLRPLGIMGLENPTVCIIAQQLRSSEVFADWLKVFFKAFRVWRVPDGELIDGLKSNSGFVIHIGISR